MQALTGQVTTGRFHREFLDVVPGVIDAWLGVEQDSRAMAVTGPPGIGKSTVLAEIGRHLRERADVVMTEVSVADAATARHAVEYARRQLRRPDSGKRLVLLADGAELLCPDERASLLDLRHEPERLRLVLTATHTSPCATMSAVASTEVGRFFLHRLQRRNPATELASLDAGELGRVCAAAFGIPAELDVLADLVSRHGLKVVAAGLGVGGPKQRFIDMVQAADARHLDMSVEEMVVLGAVLAVPGGATVSMLQHVLPRSDILRVTEALVGRGLLVGTGRLPGEDTSGTAAAPTRVHVRVSGLPVAAWCTAQPEVSMAALRQAHADYIWLRVQRMADGICGSTQGPILEEFRHERRNLLSAVQNLLDTGHHAQAIGLMTAALPLLSRVAAVVDLVPFVLQAIREYFPEQDGEAVALHKLAVRVLLAAGERETAEVCFDSLVESRPATELDDPDLVVLRARVTELSDSDEALRALSYCVEQSAAARDMQRLTDAANPYFAALMRHRQVEIIDTTCRRLMFEATRSGDDYTAGLMLLWRAAALAARPEAEPTEIRLRLERALAKLRRLGPEAVLGALAHVLDLRAPLPRHGTTRVAMVIGALGKVEWPRTCDIGICPPLLTDFAARLAMHIDVATLEEWSLAGAEWDVVDLLVRMLREQWAPADDRPALEEPLGIVQGDGVDPGQLRGRAALTRRESEVVSLVAGGLTNKQIARRLTISEWTVINHLRHVMRKLDCTSRVHVATWAQAITVPAPREE